MTNPSGRNYWREFVASGGNKLPTVSPEDKKMSATDTWKNIYKSMTIFEKGTFNANQRKKDPQGSTESGLKKKSRY